MVKVCIVGKEELKSGYPIKEDAVIKVIRTLKKKLKISTGNELMVCEKHLEEAKKKRKEFEGSVIKLVALVSVIAVIAIILAVINNTFNLLPATFALLILLGLLMVVLALFRYYPAVDEGKRAAKPSGKKKSAKKASKRSRR